MNLREPVPYSCALLPDFPPVTDPGLPATSPVAPAAVDVDDLVRQSPSPRRSRRARDHVPGPRSREPRRPDLRRHAGAGPGRPVLRPDPGRRASPPTRPPGSAAPSSTSCAAWTGRAARCAAAPARSTTPAAASPPTLGRPADGPEVAAALGIGTSELTAHREDVARASVVSLQGFDDTGIDDLLPAHTVTPADVIEQRERVAYLHDAVEHLPERLRVVVEGYFFRDLPMAELAAELGVSESRDLPAARRGDRADARRHERGPRARPGRAPRAPAGLRRAPQGGVLRQRRAATAASRPG